MDKQAISCKYDQPNFFAIPNSMIWCKLPTTFTQTGFTLGWNIYLRSMNSTLFFIFIGIPASCCCLLNVYSLCQLVWWSCRIYMKMLACPLLTTLFLGKCEVITRHHVIKLIKISQNPKYAFTSRMWRDWIPVDSGQPGSSAVGAVKDNWKITNWTSNTEIIKLYLRPTPADCKAALVW